MYKNYETLKRKIKIRKSKRRRTTTTSEEDTPKKSSISQVG